MKSLCFKAIGQHQKVSGRPSRNRLRFGKSRSTLLTGLDCDAFVLVVGFILVEPFPRDVSDWQEGPAVEEPVQDAGSLRKAGVRLLPSNLCPPPGYQAASQSVGGRRLQAEMDHQTCAFCFQMRSLLYSVALILTVFSSPSLVACLSQGNRHPSHPQMEPDAP